MKRKSVLTVVLALTMVFGSTGKVLAANSNPEHEPPAINQANHIPEPIIISQTKPTLLTTDELLELMETAPSFTETRSTATLANRRITEAEITAWIAEYWEQGINAFELEVVKLINIERERYNLNPLAVNPNLMMAARFHSQQMADLQFFSHNSPHHGRGMYRAEMFGHENIREYVWGVRENIASSTRSPQAVVEAWMNSPGHRAAILQDTFLTIGIGTVQGGGTTAKFGS